MKSPDLDFVVHKLIEDNLQTIEYYFGRDSIYLEWRESLHKSIVERILSKRTYSKNCRAYILGGAPANGKSSFLNSKFCPYPNEALTIDPDEIKVMLPEYNMMLALNSPYAASAVHEESSVISKRVRTEAMARDIDIILDGVADGTIEDRKKAYKEFKDNWYYIRTDYVSLKTNQSIKLAKIRAQETGRYVPLEFIKSMNKEISILVPQIIEENQVDELYLWDTNKKDEPYLILSLKDRKLVIHNQEKYDNFLKKAYE